MGGYFILIYLILLPLASFTGKTFSLKIIHYAAKRRHS